MDSDHNIDKYYYRCCYDEVKDELIDLNLYLSPTAGSQESPPPLLLPPTAAAPPTTTINTPFHHHLQQTYPFFFAAAARDANISPPLHHHHHHHHHHQQQGGQDENIAPPNTDTNIPAAAVVVVGTSRPRCNADTEPIDPPYPWSTDRKATIHTLDRLNSKGITVITGYLKCKRCEAMKQVDYDLHAEFIRVGSYIYENKEAMHSRAPPEWMYPTLQDCEACTQPNSLVPVIPTNEESINWLFMLLGQTLGLLSLKQLKWFCKETNHHSTGAKNRVLYYTYLTLCKQLDPAGPFDV